MRVYKAFRNGDNRTLVCLENGSSREIDPKPSQRVYNHSPNGYEWSYSGSGPAQTALAILLDYTKNPELTQRIYQTFKEQFIAPADKAGFEISSVVIDEWLHQQSLSPE